MSFGYFTPLLKPMHPNELMHPFVDPMHPNEPMCSSTFTYIGTDVPQPLWCAPSLSRFHPMLHLMLGKSPWCVHALKFPTFPTSVTLRCYNNPKFYLLEDLGDISCALIAKYLTVSHTSSSFHTQQHSKILQSPSICLNSCPHCN
jgi:hypothetical protein